MSSRPHNCHITLTRGFHWVLTICRTQVRCAYHGKLATRVQMPDHGNTNSNVVVRRNVASLDSIIAKATELVLASSYLTLAIGAFLHHRETPRNARVVDRKILKSLKGRNLPTVWTLHKAFANLSDDLRQQGLPLIIDPMVLQTFLKMVRLQLPKRLATNRSAVLAIVSAAGFEPASLDIIQRTFHAIWSFSAS